MKKTIFTVIGLALFLAAKVYAYDDGDFQIWNTDTEEFKINQDAKIALEEEFRWGDNAGEFYYQHYDAGFLYSLKKWLNIGGGYRHIYELKQGKFKLENAPYATATLLWDFKGFKFDDRNRIEYRHFDYKTDIWRYRNKVTLKFPWKFTRWGIQPYLAEELLIDLSPAHQFNQNRFSSGLSMNLTSNLKTEIYYMLQDTKASDNWVDTNVLGVKLKLAF